MRLAFSEMRLAYFEKQGAFAPSASRILENARRIFCFSIDFSFSIKAVFANGLDGSKVTVNCS